MPRILVVLSLFVLGLAPSAVYSLGLGDIDLRSALNQPFLAEIAVTSDSASDLTGLKVELASADTFRQFGLDRAGFLEGFKFEVTQRPGGAAVRIRSTQPVVEPFVTLLLEVQWPQGRLLREYTVLLDPPVFAEQSVQPSMAAPVSGPAPAPSRVTRPPEQPRSAAPAPVARPPVRSVPQLPANGDFREVRRNDTLWGIAGELQGLDPSLNRNQLMIAIYRANPDAFAGNINRLKAGVILRVPDAGQLAAESARAANAEVARQNEAWRGAAAASQSARLRLVPPPEGDSAEQTAGGAESTGTGTGSADAQALRQRIGELESQLEDNERLIEVRDQELQNLQRRLAELQGVEAPSSELQSELIDEVADEVAADEIAEPVGDEAADAETAAVAPEPEPEPEPAAAPAVRPDQVVTTQQPEDKSFIGGLFSSIWFYIALALAAMVGLFALRRRQSESPAGRWESLQPDEDDLGQETHEATTRMRAKKPQSESFVVEEVPAGSGTDDVSAYAPATGGLDLGGAPDEQETPFERTISSDVAVNLDQADPIAEAEFHMAYGLYDQAADLLSKALQSEPERKDYRLKLLEVYFIWENQSGFLDEARNFQANVETASDPDWNKVLIMGKQICPDEAMFADAPSAAGDVGEMDLAFGEDSPNVVDLSFDESPEDSLDIDLSTGSQPADPDVLEFDLGGDAESTESPTVETPTVETDMSDSPTMETPTVESPAVASTMETPTIESPGLGASTMETPTIESPGLGESTMETPTIESPAMSATMEAPTVETPSGDWDDKTEIASRVEQTAEIELDDLGLDLSELDDAGDEYAADDTGELSTGDFSDMANDESMIMKAGGAGLDATGAFDLGGGEIDDADARGVLDVDSTAEMQGLETAGGDTREQPFGGDTAEQPGPDDIESDALAAGLLDDADFDEDAAGSEDATMEMPSSEEQADGPTMTEVGTKLDLARAYIDMGDPDGARSILNEVLEEAGESQRQEARKLLDDLGDA